MFDGLLEMYAWSFMIMFVLFMVLCIAERNWYFRWIHAKDDIVKDPLMTRPQLRAGLSLILAPITLVVLAYQLGFWLTSKKGLRHGNN